MKKTLLTVLLATASAITFADGSFTGAGLEVGAGATKSDVRNVNLNEKTKGDVAVRGSYNTQFGQSNWIGGVEAGVKPLHRKIAGNAKQKVDANVSYVQGYRLTDNALAYGKAGYHYGRFDNLGAKRNNMNGLGYGVGAKYAVAPNVEVGAEWEQTRYKKDGLKVRNNSYMATVGYRFK
ncbi:porin family protein [Neisseria sicca]|uniref:porin family protein n=1 Tax=Neisseria sicca TaxID=490 RepID=UPI00066855D7|nr:porin family protein [Neisseria sicca]